MKSRALTLLKCALGAAILVWLAATGRLQFSALLAARRHYWVLALIAVLCLVQMSLAAVRWRVLLRLEGVEAKWRTVYAFTMMGAFFNTVMPGSVGGDVMKAVAASRQWGTPMGIVVTSIVIDRVIGLWALLAMGALATLANLGKLNSQPALAGVWIALWLGAAGAGLVFLPFGRRVIGLRWVQSVLARAPQWARQLIGSACSYQGHPRVVARCLWISLLCHLCAFAAFYASFLAISSPPPTLAGFAFLAPLGFLAMAVPLAPSGIGVGQAALYFLFQTYLNQGLRASNSFTVYQAVLLAVYLAGGLVYLAMRNHAQPVVAGRSSQTHPAPILDDPPSPRC